MTLERIGDNFKPQTDLEADDSSEKLDLIIGRGGYIHMPYSRQGIEMADGSPSEEVKKTVKALETNGNCIPLLEYENLFHGRVGKEGETWEVDPDFNNKGNTTGNNNVGGLASLYLGDKETAEGFAWARYEMGPYVENGREEVHQLFSTDPEARILVIGKNNQGEQTEEVKKIKAEVLRQSIPANKEIAIRPLDGMDRRHGGFRKEWLNYKKKVVEYPFEDKFNQFVDEINSTKNWLSSGENDDFLDKHVKSCINTRSLLLAKYEYVLSLLALDQHQDDAYIYLKKDADGERDIPLNKEMIRKFADNLHIVGVEENIQSATLGKEIRAALIFDMDTMVTKDQAEERIKQQEKLDRFVGVAFGFLDQEKLDKLAPELASSYSDTIKIVNQAGGSIAKQFPKAKNPMLAKTGNWEDLSVRQHTETVLGNFENNLAQHYPANALPVVRLLLLEHDIGKGINQHKPQAERNHAVSAVINREILGLTKDQHDLLWSIMGPGADLASACYLEKDGKPAVADKMLAYVQEKVRPFCQNEKDLKDFTDVFIDLCATIFFCDASAYTSVSSTRVKNKEGLVLRISNPPSFNSSFLMNTFKHRIKMR